MNRKSFFKNFVSSLCFSSFILISFATAQAEQVCGLPYIDIWDSTDSSAFMKVATVKAIETPETGQKHYNYYSSSGHPRCVNLQSYQANTWIHQDTNTDDITFGFIFGKQDGDLANSTQLKLRIVDSSTDPYISQSDDPGESVEEPSDSNIFVGNYSYGDCCSDGIAVSGISGQEWTVIIDSVDGLLTDWFFSSGACASDYANDIQLEKQHEYRVTPACHEPSKKPIFITDTDQDGIEDDEDQCLETPLGEPVDLEGCSISQLCLCDHKWKNHREYVSCVADAAETLLALGVLTEEEKNALCLEAAKSGCGSNNLKMIRLLLLGAEKKCYVKRERKTKLHQK